MARHRSQAHERGKMSRAWAMKHTRESQHVRQQANQHQTEDRATQPSTWSQDDVSYCKVHERGQGGCSHPSADQPGTDLIRGRRMGVLHLPRPRHDRVATHMSRTISHLIRVSHFLPPCLPRASAQANKGAENLCTPGWGPRQREGPVPSGWVGSGDCCTTTQSDREPGDSRVNPPLQAALQGGSMRVGEAGEITT
jgi:hypothetical protein